MRSSGVKPRMGRVGSSSAAVVVARYLPARELAAVEPETVEATMPFAADADRAA